VSIAAQKRLLAAVLVFILTRGFSQSAPQISLLTPPQLWQRLEFSIGNVPSAANPFDPDVIRLDARFALPSGGTITVPAFWYQGYQRSLSGDYESDVQTDPPGWRLRFTPPEIGNYTLSLSISTNGQPSGGPVITNFSVPAGPLPARCGYVDIAPGHQYFQTGDGQPLRLIGENVCWGDGPATYSYDTWFAAMQRAGQNYARIWMSPWAFGIEDTPAARTNYSPGPAWQLDYVLHLAEVRGIYVLLCLDYHGMFVTQPDPTWGGNNYWPQNPYNVTNGGPCAVANDFFTNATAQKLYQKRLRYLVARYGYSQNLLAWELFNEIDNDYSFLKGADVAAWHGVMGGWLHTNDGFGHLVTTSLTGNSDRPEIWSLPQLDFAAYHSYGEPVPAGRLATVAQSFLQRYGKPIMVGEFGTDSGGWNRTNDPYLRGWRQGIWGAALGGSVGTAMSWWWQNIDAENDYAGYSALGAILNRTGWGRGLWTNVTFQTAGPPPVTVGNPVSGGQPVNVQLPLNGGWGTLTPGRLAVPGPAAVGYSANALEGFVHGIWHSDLKTPFVLNAWLTNNARLVMHLNSVSDGSIMAVRVDGAALFSTNLPNLDGTYNVNEEYNLDIPVSLPAGLHSIAITNTGNDWFYLDWVRLEQVLPAAYAGNWSPSAEGIGLQGPHESLLYVVAPGVSFPADATTATLPIQHAQTVTLTNWPASSYIAEWYAPATGAALGTSQTTTRNGGLALALPDYAEDLAAIVHSPPRLTPLGISSTDGFQFQLDSETGGHYLIQESFDLVSWWPILAITNTTGTILFTDRFVVTNAQSFFRASPGN
jgi:hypothetical protein